MAKKRRWLAGIGLALAVAAPLAPALAQRNGEPPQDPNQPRKDQQDTKPVPKGGEPPRLPANRGAAPPPPKAQQPGQPDARPGPANEHPRRGGDLRRDGGGGPGPREIEQRRRDERPPQPPVNVQQPAQTPPVALPPSPDARRGPPPPQQGAPAVSPPRPPLPPVGPALPPVPPRADPNVNKTLRPERPVTPPPGPGAGNPAVSPVRPPQPAATLPDAAGGPAVSRVRPAGTPPVGAALPPAPAASGNGPKSGFTPGFRPSGPPVTKLEDVQKGRIQRTEAGGRRTIIQETDNRVIIKQNNTTIIRHDETQRFAKDASTVRSTRRGDGTTQTVIVRPGGAQLFNIVDNNGRLVRRYRRDQGGREINIIDNRRFYRNAAFIGAGLIAGAIILNLREPDVRIPRERYIVDYERASDDDLYETLSSPPVDRLERSYSLEEIRYNVQLRDRMRRLDLDAVTFPTGSWEVGNEQFPKLERLARIMNRIIDRNPGEVFMIEGHTDAVGPSEDNLTLSDRRAQAVAEILSGVFSVPPENLVTQGYGEQFLKIDTASEERLNRRVAVRRISPLLGEAERQDRR